MQGVLRSILQQTWGRLLAYFLAGVFAVLPLVITTVVVLWVADFVNEMFGPETYLGARVGQLGRDIGQNEQFGVLIGWLIVLALVFLLGVAIVELGAKKIQGLVDAVVARIPLIGNIYGTTKQLVAMFDQGEKEQLKGMAPVFCYFGRDRTAGVLALLVSPERYRINDRDFQIIIVPTAPVPFGGGLLFMPVESIEPAAMSVDSLMSIYVSMGVTAPGILPVAESAGRGPMPAGDAGPGAPS